MNAFAINTATEQWDAFFPGTYNILIGASSQDVRVQGHFKLQSELTLKTLALGITT